MPHVAQTGMMCGVYLRPGQPVGPLPVRRRAGIVWLPSVCSERPTALLVISITRRRERLNLMPPSSCLLLKRLLHRFRRVLYRFGKRLVV